ncbi:MAG: hypothetical protein HYV07_11005 [Deltaproteobacteria bacterium]|nr:hypothetical protein [Deltaproteobacteria bacterium]
MNPTLAVDEKLVEKARKVARERGTSLNSLIRQYLETLVGQRGGAFLAQELERQWKASPGRSKGKRIRREDAYSERV